MSIPAAFLQMLRSEFPDNRLTWQKNVVTFHPETAEEAARLFRLANRSAQKLYITGFGNNIDPQGEPFVDLVSIRTDRLNRLHEVSRSDLYIRVGSGYPLREINTELGCEELFLPHATFPYVGSVGGAVAVNVTGVLHGHEVPIKRYLIQAEIVTPEGEIITPGAVAFKSVAGYDIVKVFAASWGVLGLVVDATFRVMPISAADEFAAMTMAAVDRSAFLAGLDERNRDTDAVYSRKIKARFDPVGVLPIVP